jgi:hypothetical protein
MGATRESELLAEVIRCEANRYSSSISAPTLKILARLATASWPPSNSRRLVRMYPSYVAGQDRVG